jgi:hypothetical protein
VKNIFIIWRHAGKTAASKRRAIFSIKGKTAENPAAAFSSGGRLVKKSRRKHPALSLRRNRRLGAAATLAGVKSSGARKQRPGVEYLAAYGGASSEGGRIVAAKIFGASSLKASQNAIRAWRRRT